MKAMTCLSLCAGLLASSAARAEPGKCPFHEEGVYPWSMNVAQVVSGDSWAWIYLDLDKHGYPMRCYIGDSNLSGPEIRSDVCRNFVAGWRATPLMKDGRPVAGTTRRFFVMLGERHKRMLDDAQRKWFAEHPDDDPACYRGDANLGR